MVSNQLVFFFGGGKHFEKKTDTHVGSAHKRTSVGGRRVSVLFYRSRLGWGTVVKHHD